MRYVLRQDLREFLQLRWKLVNYASKHQRVNFQKKKKSEGAASV
jgi:hypothetical protein